MNDKVRIDVTVLDSEAISIIEDSSEAFFMIGEYRAYIPSHYFGKNFNAQEVLSFFIDKLGDIGVGVIVCFLYDLLKNKKIKNIKINNKTVDTEDKMREALNDESKNQ